MSKRMPVFPYVLVGVWESVFAFPMRVSSVCAQFEQLYMSLYKSVFVVCVTVDVYYIKQRNPFLGVIPVSPFHLLPSLSNSWWQAFFLKQSGSERRRSSR